MTTVPEVGDIVVFTKEDTFPMGNDAERTGVVESVDEDEGTVDLGVDGVVPLAKINGKSPSVSDDN